MRKILFIILIILLIAGCKPIEQPVAETVDTQTTESISETDEIAELEDTEAEQELDGIDSLLDDW